MKSRHNSSKRDVKTRRLKTKPRATRPKRAVRAPRSVGASAKSRSTAAKVQIKRAYESPSPRDGTRILVDRLWPRGVKRSAAALDGWLKDIAPSDALRHWFHNEPETRWKEFQVRYRAELRAHARALQPLHETLRKGSLTLVYSAHDPDKNNAVVLREFLLAHFRREAK